MLEALHELFGRSTVDPQVQEAFELGQIENILVECGFPAETACWLAGLTADDFEDFLALVYREVQVQLAEGEHQAHRWPTDGLAEADKGKTGPGDHPGMHQAA